MERDATRKLIVDILEFTYAPVFLSVAFSLFLATSDAAFEVIVALADDAAGFAAALGVDLTSAQAFFVYLMLLIVAFTVIVTAAGTAHRVETWLVNRGFSRRLVRTLATLLTMVMTVVIMWAVQRWAPRFGLVRVLNSCAMFFFVPVGLYQATRIGLHAMLCPDKRRMPSDFRLPWQAQMFLLLVGRLPLIGAAIGILRAIYSGEAQDSELALWAFFTLCVLAVVGRILWAVLAGKAKTAAPRPRSFYDRATRRCMLAFPYILATICGYVIATTLIPAAAEQIGPVGIVSAFVILASVGLAWLTWLSACWPPLRGFPLILLLPLLALTWSGAGTAMMLGLALLVMTGLAFLFQWPLNRPMQPRIFWTMLAVALLVLGAGWLQGRSFNHCRTWAGCNVIYGVAPHTVDAPTVEQAFDQWQRAGVYRYSAAISGMQMKGSTNDNTPIRLVAAQGGGLFTGYLTAYYLAHKADTDSRFADSIFAMSGVSGGSVGAAVFWAIRKSGICRQNNNLRDCHRRAVIGILARDYLSAPLTRLLFLDNLDTLLPFSAFVDQPVDRGQLMVERLDTIVRDYVAARRGVSPETVEPLLNMTLTDSWSSRQREPMLFLNAVDMYSGERVIHSPASALSDDRPAPATRAQIADPQGNAGDLTVGQAAIISARFPIVTPPARYGACQPECAAPVLKQLGDGGYFDNSGLETLWDVLEAMPVDGRPVEIISLTVREKTDEQIEAGRSTKGLLAAPISGLLSASRARRSLTVTRFCERWRDAGGSPSIRVVRLDVSNATTETRSNNFTLSWLLAQSTFNSIENAIGPVEIGANQSKIQRAAVLTVTDMCS